MPTMILYPAISKYRVNQRGITLVVVLIFMVVLTLLGITGMRTARLQEQMAGARHERVASLAASHAALADGRDFVFSAIDPTAASSKIQSVNEYIGSVGEGWTIKQWVLADTDWISGPYAQTLGTGSGINYTMLRTNGAAVARNPTYIVQEMVPQAINYGSPVPAYRVTSRGEGGNPDNAAYLQSIYRFYISPPN
jgi:type IV pilus assembly protein PilX